MKKYIQNLVVVAAGAALATSSCAQSARDVRGGSPYVAIENEPAPRLVVDPPLPEGLVQGVYWAQYRVENLRIVPVFGPGALQVSPRLGHLHVTVDDLPWWWADASDDNTVDIAGLPPGQHRVKISLVDANHDVIPGQVVTQTFTVPDDAKGHSLHAHDAYAVSEEGQRGVERNAVDVALGIPRTPTVDASIRRSARDVRGGSPYVAIENEPAPRLIVDPPLPEGLVQGVYWAQYRVENLRIVPVFGPGALQVSPRLGHLHVTVDDLPWWWADASDNNTIDIAGLPPGQHRVKITLVDANHDVFPGQVVTQTFTVPDGARAHSLHGHGADATNSERR